MSAGERGTRRLLCRSPFEPWDCSCCGTPQAARAPSSVLSGLTCDACLDRGVIGRGEPYVPLSVRAVNPSRRPDRRPIVAVSMLLERCALDTGESFDLGELVDRVRERRPGECGRGGGARSRARAELPPRLPASIIVTDNALDLLAYLDNSACARSPFWQWQVSIRATGGWRREARTGRARGFLTAKPLRFGFASRHGKRRRANGESLWWMLLDPGQFCELPDGWPSLDLVELVRFGTELRGWANAAQLPIFAGVSSYGSRLLRDARFGDGWRRKVPAATNAKIRLRLAGNHYQLLTAVDRTHLEVHKFDQASAHHHAALTSRFPHADLLNARGWFRQGAPPAGAPFTARGPIRVGTARHDDLLAQSGMFVIALGVPERIAIDALALPQLRKPGRSWQTLTSAEVEYVRTLRPQGVKLLDIWCAWTSPEDDDRLRDYAMWAGEQLRHTAGRRWLKPLLLATYGMLAVRPSRFRNGWRWTSQREHRAIGWSTRHGMLVGEERSGERDREPATANVLWRAIIESRVRMESLRFAQHLRSVDARPIAVYADAVFATGSVPAGPLPAPWRHDGTVHDLTFDSPGRYRSREETRLPGTPRAGAGLTPALPAPTIH